MPFIKVIQHDEAEGRLKEIYDQLVKSRGKLAEVHKIQSLNPESIVAHMELYMKIMFGKSPLRRYQREMIAVIVSSANDCEYCIRHHAEALQFFWKDEEKVNQLSIDYHSIDLSEKDNLFCQFAQKLTVDPNFEGKKELLDQMKALDVEDRAILDVTLVVSYFNFVNRMVLGLGVDLEKDGGSGYNYD
jgi:uncharacterized peroxidase-related enzyme